MYLLDTNICIAIIKGNENVVSHFHKKHESCYLATLVLAELYKGVYCSSKVERNLDNLQRFASLLPKNVPPLTLGLSMPYLPNNSSRESHELK